MKGLAMYEIADLYRSALEEFAENDESSTEVPDSVWLETIDALEGDIVAKGRGVTAYILELSARVEMVRSHIKLMQKKAKSLEAKEEWLRNYLKTNMEKSGITKIEAVDGTFSASLGKPVASVAVDDLELLPEEFVRVKIEKSADKIALKKALESGFQTSAAHLEFNPRLTIK